MLSGLLRHDRLFVIAGLLGVILISWIYLLTGAGMAMPAMGGMLMEIASPAWTPGYFALTLAMWAVMMAAMMLPAAAPMLLLYDKIARQRADTGKAIGSTSLFGLGYIAVWAGFRVAAVAARTAPASAQDRRGSAGHPARTGSPPPCRRHSARRSSRHAPAAVATAGPRGHRRTADRCCEPDALILPCGARYAVQSG